MLSEFDGLPVFEVAIDDLLAGLVNREVDALLGDASS